MLERSFPGLKGTGYEIASPRTPEYNCIAWAAGETSRFWWPQEQAYWPPDVPRETTIDAFIEAFGTLGFSPCDRPDKERGIEKVALYAKGDEPKHAARQLESGMWSSKLGRDVDINHTLEGLAGHQYGDVVKILKRPRR